MGPGSKHADEPATPVPSSPPDVLTLAEVAERLGVHYVTAYRYVRHGQLPAHQEGRRWCVASESLQKFLNRAEGSSSDLAPVDSEVLLGHMVAGDEVAAWDLLERAGATGDPIVAQEELIAPVLREIGRRWSIGEASIAQEHRATAVASRLIGRLGSPTRRGRRLGKVFVVCPPGDTHELATSFFANVLRAEGAEVVDLGQMPSAAAILTHLDSQEGRVGVAIACTMSEDHARVAALATELRRSEAIGCIAVGGAAVPDRKTAEALGSDTYEVSARYSARAIITHLRETP